MIGVARTAIFMGIKTQVNFTKTEKRCLKSALLLAMDTELSHVDAYRTKLVIGKAGVNRVIPLEYRKAAQRSYRNLRNWNVLLKRLHYGDGEL